MAKNFGRIFCPHKFLGAGTVKIVPVRILPLTRKLLRRIRWILSPIFNFRDYNFLGGPPSQLGCALDSLGQSLARVKVSGRSTPWGPRYSIPKKCILVGPISHLNLGNYWTKVHGICFLEFRRNRSRYICYYDLDVLSRSGDIRGHSRTLQKIDRNFACFWPPEFFGGGPRNFPSLLGDSSQISIVWQSFAAIGWETSEMWLSKKRKKNIRGKTKARPELPFRAA